MRTKNWTIVALLAFSSLALADDPASGGINTDPVKASEATPQKAEAPKEQKAEKKADALKKLDEKRKELSELREQSVQIMARMADAAKDGTLLKTQEGTDLLQELVNQMKEVNQRLQKVEEEIEDIKGWIEGQNEAQPIITQDIFDLKRNRGSMYMQLQYRTQTKPATQQSGFRNRRIRIGGVMTVDSKTSMRYSFDLGTGANQTAAQLRDAYLIYDVIPSDTQVGLQFRGGQQPLLLGYELERSSGDREFPERARYNQLFFDGERSTGVTGLYGLNEKTFVHAGIMNSLTYNDPEQRTFGNDSTQRNLGYAAGARYHTEQFDFGVSAFTGVRPRYAVPQGTGTGSPANVTAGAIKRKAFYVDMTLVPAALKGFFVRAEYMQGTDRDNLGQSTSSSRATAASYGRVNTKGWHTVLGYNLNTRNQVSFKLEETDPNTGIKNNVIKGIGLGYQYWIGPTSKIGFFVEEFREPGRKFKVWTIRSTFRF